MLKFCKNATISPQFVKLSIFIAKDYKFKITFLISGF